MLSTLLPFPLPNLKKFLPSSTHLHCLFFYFQQVFPSTIQFSVPIPICGSTNDLWKERIKWELKTMDKEWGFKTMKWRNRPPRTSLTTSTENIIPKKRSMFCTLEAKTYFTNSNSKCHVSYSSYCRYHN